MEVEVDEAPCLEGPEKLMAAVLEAAVFDCRALIREGLRMPDRRMVGGLSAAAFFLSEYGKALVEALTGRAGVRKAQHLANAALAAVGLAPGQVLAINPKQWEIAIESGSIPGSVLAAIRRQQVKTAPMLALRAVAA